MEVHATTDVGRVRDTNGDTVLTESFGRVSLLVVADGMGGHAAGDVASSIAAETVRDRLSDSLPTDPAEHVSPLDEAITEANRAV